MEEGRRCPAQMRPREEEGERVEGGIERESGGEQCVRGRERGAHAWERDEWERRLVEGEVEGEHRGGCIYIPRVWSGLLSRPRAF